MDASIIMLDTADGSWPTGTANPPAEPGGTADVVTTPAPRHPGHRHLADRAWR